jgi:hypothetical protein
MSRPKLFLLEDVIVKVSKKENGCLKNEDFLLLVRELIDSKKPSKTEYAGKLCIRNICLLFLRLHFQ